MLQRTGFINRIHENFGIHPITGLLGPRQCGKTTLAKIYSEHFNTKGAVYRFDLEDPSLLAQLENPKLVLDNLSGLIIMDEIQLRPDLFSYLRVLSDAKPHCQYLVLGSASRDLIQQSSESLAGRIGYIELTPFQLQECGPDSFEALWQRGGFPRSFLATTEQGSLTWRKAYIQTFLERDLSLLGFHVSPQEMRKLWVMLAHYHGNIINYSELGRSLAVSDMTVRRYIDILQGAFMIRVLQPWFENIKKRQIKSPKLYIRDSGLLHALLDISVEQIPLHPKIGASWEGYAMEEIIRFYKADPEDCYFWSTQSEAELDLMIMHHGKKLGFEFKFTDHPKLSASMKSAQEILKLDEFHVIVPGETDFPLSETIRVLGLKQFIFGKYAHAPDGA